MRYAVREVALRERPTGARFEIAFEPDGGLLVAELHGHDDLPRSVPGRVSAVSSVVRGESSFDVRRQPHIGSIRVFETAKKIHKSFRCGTHETV
jgi:hypothetical protein